MQVGVVSKWLKSQGEAVIEGEPICTVEGDKATVDIEAPATGILKKIVAKEGEEFPVKKPMAYIGNRDDVVEISSNSDNKISDGSISFSDDRKKEFGTLSSDKRIKASPIAKRLAKENGIDLSKIGGTGPDGLIGKDDVLAFRKVEQQHHVTPASGDLSKRLSGIAKVMAERMAQSNLEIPHFHLSISCDINLVEKMRKDANKKNKKGQHFTITDILIWASSRALKQHKILNSSFQTNKVLIHEKINIGLAVDSPNGLLVLVIKEADEKSLSEIARKREEVIQRAKLGKQIPEDLAGGTFTITNLGMYGIDSFDPIILPGQVGILGVGASTKIYEMDESGSVKSSEKISITLGCDHRVVDGVAGAEFLSSFREILNNPTKIFAVSKSG